MMNDRSPLTLIDKALFSPEKPIYLGVCRLVMFGWLFVWYFITDLAFIAEYPVQMWAPVPLLELVGLTAQPSYAVVTTLKAIWEVSLFLACIGLFTRYSIAASFLIGLYLLAASHSFYKINHSDAGLLMAMFILMLSRCGDAFSVDSLSRVWNQKGLSITPPSGEYRWPVQIIRIIWVIVFFLAGVAKLRNGGMDWMFSDSMANLILRKQYVWEPPTSMAWYFLSHPWTCAAMSAGAVIIELLAPLVLFSKIARLLIVPAMLGMQIGIRLIMGDDFTQFMAIYLFFVPWLFIGALSARFAPSKTIDVLYDGKCGLCGRTIALLQRLDLLGRLRFRDIVSDWQAIHQNYPAIDREAAFVDMHVVDSSGRVISGFEGYRRMAWACPLGWVFLPLLYFPGVSIVGRRVYRRIADRRMLGGQCAI